MNIETLEIAKELEERIINVESQLKALKAGNSVQIHGSVACIKDEKVTKYIYRFLQKRLSELKRELGRL